MKKHAAVMLILMVAGLVGVVQAQSGTTIIADVPFNYMANGKTMPAGEVRVRIENDGEALLRIASGGQQSMATPQVDNSTKANDATVLVFHRYGERYFLAGAASEGQKLSYALPMGSLEKELQRSNAEEKTVRLVASIRLMEK